MDEQIVIQKTLFETDNPIDDLVLRCNGSKTVFLQIKRKLSLSVAEDSEFYKTISQFVRAYLLDPYRKEFFGIITSTDSSSKVTGDFKKIVSSLRLNIEALKDNPLNESEEETLVKVKSLVNSIFLAEKQIEPDEATVAAFLSKIFVAVVDIETGRTIDISTLMLLRGIGFRNPQLIWSLMISNCLVYASKRLSVDTQKLADIFDLHLKKETGAAETGSLKDLDPQVSSLAEFSTAKEVLLIRSFLSEVDLMAVELFRFTADCQKVNTFSNGHVITPGKDRWEVIQRFATLTGFDRYMIENEDRFQHQSLAIVPATSKTDLEKTDCAKVYKDYLQRLIEENSDMHLCLHCGKKISPEDALVVEIDDAESSPAFGNAHKSCIRPVDRIMGKVIMPDYEPDPYLDAFDFKLWVSLLIKGQGLLNHLKSTPNMLQGRKPVISWNSNEEYDADYSYCIRFNLEDGSCSYAYQRGRIERLNKSDASNHLSTFEHMLEKHRAANDPWCVLSRSKDAGLYSDLLRRKEKGEKVLEIVSVEVAKYSKMIAKAFDRTIYYYAPMCMVRDKETEQLFNLGNIVPLISDPLAFEDLVDNWKQFDIDVSGLELKIIKSDQDFDNQLRLLFGYEMVPVIDPLFDKNGMLLSGYEIRQYSEVLKQAMLRQQNGDQS